MNDFKNKEGVFGDGIDRSKLKKTKDSRSKVPVIDVIGIGITVVILGFILFNFDEITDTLFQLLLPLLTNFFLIVIVLFVLIFFIWYRTTSRRRW